MEPLRILHVIGAMDRGGAETLIMNLYRKIDRTRLQFDFLTNETRKCDYDNEIIGLGGNIYRIPRYRISNYSIYRKSCRKFFTEHSYSIVHGHIALPASIYLNEAKAKGAFCVAHSHAQNYPLSPSEAAFRICSFPTRFHADYFLGCSQQAGIDRYGVQIVNSDKFHVLNNGIDIDTVRFDQRARCEIRSELSLDQNAPVFGHVGRLAHIKNHPFLLETFSHIRQVLPNAHLLLVGRGEDEKQIRQRIRELELEENTHLLGVRDDIPRILSSIDVFVFPSYKEGLSNAAVEAQASGARCLLSTGVPELARINEETVFEPLSSGAEKWAEIATNLYRHPLVHRKASADDARVAGFDINESVSWLTDFYLNHSSNAEF